ncbi:MAG: hypothetical protein KDA99_07960, partial [Planctomycetales bacterium]|nr:hypothetical protein [Planctomycetales bacterium]
MVWTRCQLRGTEVSSLSCSGPPPIAEYSLFVTVCVTLGFTVCGSLVSSVFAADPAGELGENAVKEAYLSVHDGWSADEVLVNDALNARFVAACRQRVAGVADVDCNATLLRLRKAGKLPGDVTKRRRLDHGEYWHAAEIAARSMEDRHEVNIDRVMCDPQLRAEFDRLAGPLAVGVELYRLRKAALALRKSRRLRPELIARVADWEKRVESYGVDELRGRIDEIPRQPGIYIFHDASGYLYVGEAADLRVRLTQHLGGSDRVALADYLREREVDGERSGEGADSGEVRVEMHIFAADSP